MTDETSTSVKFDHVKETVVSNVSKFLYGSNDMEIGRPRNFLVAFVVATNENREEFETNFGVKARKKERKK